MGTKHKKLSSKDKVKIQARFNLKYAEYIKLPLNDKDGVKGLRSLYKEKMSNTDRLALSYAIDYVLRNPVKEEGIDRIDELQKLKEEENEP